MPIQKQKYLKKRKPKHLNEMKCFIQVDLVENDEKSKSARTFIQALIIN